MMYLTFLLALTNFFLFCLHSVDANALSNRHHKGNLVSFSTTEQYEFFGMTISENSEVFVAGTPQHTQIVSQLVSPDKRDNHY